MKGSICRLPFELIESISTSLEPTDLLSLRLTCKILYGKTLDFFGSRCLQTVRTDLSPSSIGELEELSKHDQLKHHVQRLSIRGSKDKPLGRGYHWKRWNGFSFSHLLVEQRCSRQLQDILHLLPNCRSFEICRYSREPNSELASLTNYEVDRTVPKWLVGCLTPGDAITLMLNLIGETGLPVRSFQVNIHLPNVSSGSYGNPAQRYTPDLQRMGFYAGWSHLEELSISQSLTSDLINWAMSLIQTASRLKTLRLDFDSSPEANALIDRLFFVSDTLPQLQEFEIENASEIPPDSFIGFLRHSRHSLRTLSLRHATIGGFSGALLVFRALRDEFPSLESFNMERRMDGPAGGHLDNAFPVLSDDMPLNVARGTRITHSYNSLHGNRRIYHVVFSSTDMDFALRTLIEEPSQAD